MLHESYFNYCSSFPDFLPLFRSARCGSGLMDDSYSCHETSFGLVAVKTYSGNYNWEEARTKCSQDGTGDVKGELATPLSSTENEWFVNKAKELRLGAFWLGVTDKDVEGTWTNLYGRQTYFNWYAGEPNNHGQAGQDCAKAGGDHLGHKWDDGTCGGKLQDLLCTQVEG